MGLKLIPPGQGRSERDYYIRFEGSMYGVLRVDNEAHTVNLVPLKELDNIPVFVEPLNPYELHGVRVFDSSSFRMVLCFFDRFYVTVGDMHVLEFDSPQAYMEHMRVSLYDAVVFPHFSEGQETNPWRTLTETGDAVWSCTFAPTEEGLDPDPRSMFSFVCDRRIEIDGSLTLERHRSIVVCDSFETNSFSTGAWRLVSVRRHTTP